MPSDILTQADNPARPAGRISVWVTWRNTSVFFTNIPRGVYVGRILCHVTEAFNAGSGSHLTVGWSDDTDAIMTSLDVSSTGEKSPSRGVNAGYNSIAQNVYVYSTQSGTPATTGKAVLTLEILPLPPIPS